MATYQPPRGMRDFAPEEARKLFFILDAMKSVFQKWGFDPLETPIVESWDLLAAKSGGGEEIKKEIYYFKDKSDRELGLRFDLTVPLARFFAANQTLPRPFKRYQVGPVFRYDRPGLGRYRQFYQSDIDIIGTEDMGADALIIAMTCDVLKQLGFTTFTIRVNNRKLVQEYVESLGTKKQQVLDIFRSIDKLDKIGLDGVEEELKSRNIDTKFIPKILNMISIKDLIKIKKMTQSIALSELERLFALCTALGCDKYVQFDMSLVRGLDYYTSTVFEATLGENLSCAGGGRYDDLVNVLGGKSTPAVGISFGVERILAIMEEQQLFTSLQTTTRIFVATVVPETRQEAVRVVRELISSGIAAEFDLMGRTLKKQLEYVNTRNIPFVIVLGEKELQSNTLLLRDMRTGNEQTLPRAKLASIESFF